MQKELDELGALFSKLQLGDDEMSNETYIQMEGEETTKLEQSIDEFVDVALGINYAQGCDLNVDVHSKDVEYVAPHTIKLSNAKRHASLLSNFLVENFLYILMLTNFQISKVSRKFRSDDTYQFWVGNTKDL